MQLGAQFLETRASLKNRHKPAVANNWVSKLFHIFIKKKTKQGREKIKHILEGRQWSSVS